MIEAKVVWFNSEKGFGFAQSADGQSIFIHYSAIDAPEAFKQLRKNALIEIFEIESEDGVLRATQVRSSAKGGNA